MPKINIAAIIESTNAEGPGKRMAIWVQGCLKRCVDCCNEDFWEIKPVNIADCDEIIEKIKKAREKHGIDGITFVGGEPMLQAKGLSYIASKAREEGLGVITFTGYTMEELDELKPEGYNNLITNSDILITGPFIKERYDEKRRWAGSDNQVFHYLTDRYEKGTEYKQSELEIEIRIMEGNAVEINGWGEY